MANAKLSDAVIPVISKLKSAVLAYLVDVNVSYKTTLGALQKFTSGADSVMNYMTDAQITAVETRSLGLDVSDAINAALAAGSKRLMFPPGAYYLGSYTDGQVAIDLSSYGDNITLETSSDVEFVMTSLGLNSHPRFFFLKGNSHFSVGDCRFRDLGYDATGNRSGGVCFYIEGTNVDTSNYRFGKIWGKRVGVGLQVVKYSLAHTGKVRDIRGHFNIDEALYGANFANLGDNVDMTFITRDCLRAYYVYGANTHNVVVQNSAPAAGTGQVNIARGVNNIYGANDTKDIRVKYSCVENVNSVNHVLIDQFADAYGTIDGVYLDLNISDAEMAVWFTNYTTDGGVPTGVQTPGLVVNNIFIRGAVGGYIGGPANYSTKPYVRVEGVRWLEDWQDKYTQSREVSHVTTINPSTSGSFVPGASGSILQRMFFAEGMVQVMTRVQIVGAPTLGVGYFIFFLPLPNKCSFDILGTARIVHGGAYHHFIAHLSAGNAFFTLTKDGSGTNVGAASPFVLADGDTIDVTITYPV